MFTHQHYVEIAKVLREPNDPSIGFQPFYYYTLVKKFLELFKKDNLKFDEIKFLNAISRRGGK